jgi:hypothetical protein
MKTSTVILIVVSTLSSINAVDFTIWDETVPKWFLQPASGNSLREDLHSREKNDEAIEKIEPRIIRGSEVK